MLRKTGLAILLIAAAGIAGAARADGDADKGAKVFNKCKACHAIGEGAKNKVGPELNGIVGRAAGSAEGFKYSSAMEAKKAAGLIWTEDELKAFLTKPKDYAPGTKMSFPGLTKDDEREDVIAYLKTFK